MPPGQSLSLGEAGFVDHKLRNQSFIIRTGEDNRLGEQCIGNLVSI
jgi:hypothetical protein